MKKSPKILIIDDNAAILHALELFLSNEGFAVETRSEYSDYLAELESVNFPNLIILDILLAEENGRVIAKKLKDDKRTREIPIIMISAHPSGGRMAKEAGADAFLAKPFGMDDLINAISRLVKSSNQRQKSLL